MATVTAPPGPQEGFGATARKDAWWAGPLATLLGLLAFLIYANFIVFFVPGYFEIRQNKDDFFSERNPVVAPYLAPFHAPLLFDAQSPHAWFSSVRPTWWPGWFPFSSAMLILIFPAGFRLTCYYYRKAYYRAFWADPPACAVGEPRKSYWGENHWPLLFQNIHRYFMYAALIFLFLLGWDALKSFVWPIPDHYNEAAGHWEYRYRFGMGLGTLLLVANVVLLSGYTLGCHSLRHLVGGRLDCFSCPMNNGGGYQTRPGYKAWRSVTWFNERHMLFAWLSLFSVGFSDLYVRLCAAGVWSDPHFILGS